MSGEGSGNAPGAPPGVKKGNNSEQNDSPPFETPTDKLPGHFQYGNVTHRRQRRKPEAAKPEEEPASEEEGSQRSDGTDYFQLGVIDGPLDSKEYDEEKIASITLDVPTLKSFSTIKNETPQLLERRKFALEIASRAIEIDFLKFQSLSRRELRQVYKEEWALVETMFRDASYVNCKGNDMNPDQEIAFRINIRAYEQILVCMAKLKELAMDSLLLFGKTAMEVPEYGFWDSPDI